MHDIRILVQVLARKGSLSRAIWPCNDDAFQLGFFLAFSARSSRCHWVRIVRADFDRRKAEATRRRLDALTKQAPLGPSEVWATRLKDFNKPFSDQPGFQWLNRDAAEVEKYLNDPECGFAFSNELARDIAQGSAALRTPAREARISKTLPILVVQGSLDPVGGNLQGTQALLDRYRALGVSRISHKFYDGARHEVLNEINRDEVTRDVIDWLMGVS